jgi:tyrosine-protein phosphatase SIW14
MAFTAPTKTVQGISLAMLLAFFLILAPSSGSAGGPLQSGKAAAAALSLPEGAKTSERIIGLPGLPNVGRVAPGIFRGGQPLAEGYPTLKKMGIRTVINLRHSHSEKAAVETLGMKSIEIPINTFKRVDKKTVDRVVDLMADPSLQPVYVHCALGQDRTGVVVAAYRMRKEGWTLREAEVEMQAFGFNDIWINLKDFIEDYAEH